MPVTLEDVRREVIPLIKQKYSNYKSDYDNIIFNSPDYLKAPENFSRYFPGTQELAQTYQSYGLEQSPLFRQYMQEQYGYNYTPTGTTTGTTSGAPEENIVNTQTLLNSINALTGNYDKFSGSVQQYIENQGKYLDQYQQVQQLLMKAILHNMYQPKMTGNPFLDAITNYTYTRRLVQPDYQFQGLLGKYIAKKYAPVKEAPVQIPPTYGPLTEQEFNRQRYITNRFNLGE